MSEGSEGTESPKLKGAALEEQRQRDNAKVCLKFSLNQAITPEL